MKPTPQISPDQRNSRCDNRTRTIPGFPVTDYNLNRPPKRVAASLQFLRKVAYVWKLSSEFFSAENRRQSCIQSSCSSPLSVEFSLADYLGPRCRDAPGQELLTGDQRRPLARPRSLSHCVSSTQAVCHRADFAVADVAIVDLNNAGEFALGASANIFVSTINVDRRQIGFDAADFFGGCNLDHSCAIIPSGHATTLLVARSPSAR